MKMDSVKAVADQLRPAIDEAVATKAKAFDDALDAKLDAKLRPLVDQITDVQAIVRTRNVTPPPAGIRPLYENGSYQGKISIPNMDTSRFRLSMILRGMARGDWRGAEYEREVFDEVAKQKTSLTLADDAGVGFYIPNEVMREIIDPLRPASVKSRLGIQMWTGLQSSPVEVPRQTGVETGYWVGEDTAVTHSKQTADRIKVSPKIGAILTSASLSLLSKEPGLVEQRIRMSIARELDLLQDAALFEGTGVSRPLGLANIAGINTFSFAGATHQTIWSFAQKMIMEVEADNVDIMSGAFVMHARAWHTFWNMHVQRSYSGDTNQFLRVEPGGPGGRPTYWLHGYPVIICNSLAASSTTVVYFANWADVIWASWMNPGIAYSDQADDAFKNLKGYFRIVEECDVNVEHPESVCTGTALTYVTSP